MAWDQFTPDKVPQSKSGAGEGSGGKKDANKHADQSGGTCM